MSETYFYLKHKINKQLLRFSTACNQDERDFVIKEYNTKYKDSFDLIEDNK